jgi:hypothetical protein
MTKGQHLCEEPRFIFFPSNYTFTMLKTYIASMFKFLKGKEIRLWRLVESFNQFMEHYKVNIKVKVFHIT